MHERLNYSLSNHVMQNVKIILSIIYFLKVTVVKFLNVVNDKIAFTIFQRECCSPRGSPVAGWLASLTLCRACRPDRWPSWSQWRRRFVIEEHGWDFLFYYCLTNLEVNQNGIYFESSLKKCTWHRIIIWHTWINKHEINSSLTKKKERTNSTIF